MYFKIQSVAQIRTPRLQVRATTKCRFSERKTQVELKDNMKFEYWYTSLKFILPFDSSEKFGPAEPSSFLDTLLKNRGLFSRYTQSQSRLPRISVIFCHDFVIESFVYRSDSIRARELRIPLFSRAGHLQRAAPAEDTPGDVSAPKLFDERCDVISAAVPQASTSSSHAALLFPVP